MAPLDGKGRRAWSELDQTDVDMNKVRLRVAKDCGGGGGGDGGEGGGDNDAGDNDRPDERWKVGACWVRRMCTRRPVQGDGEA